MEVKNVLLIIIILVILSPLFGVILADLVGYHEPLDIAAEKLGLHDITDDINWTPFLDYTIPGMPDWIGYILAGFIGIGIILGLGQLMKRVVGRKA